MQVKNIANPANELLKSRRSVRKYDPSVKIGRDEIRSILQDATTAPSSLNLQPWRFVVIDSDEAKSKIKPLLMFNQMQAETASAFILVLGDKEHLSCTAEVLSGSVQLGLMKEEEAQKRKEKIEMYTGSYTEDKIKDVLLFDCGLVSMQIMLAAKAYGYDTNAIGGFMKKEIAGVLEIDLARYLPVILLSVGKADEPEYNTARFAVDEITTWK